MKKLYLLAFMAATTLGLSAQTQNVASQAPKHASIQTETNQSPAVKMLTMPNNSLLRSTNTNLPDSVIQLGSNGEKAYKFLFEFNDMGLQTLQTAYQWDATISDWSDEVALTYKYEYDENGKMTRQVYEVPASGYTETTINIYDQQGRLINNYFVSPTRHTEKTYFYGEDNICHYFSYDSVYTEDGKCSNRYVDMKDYYKNDAGQDVKIVHYTFDEWQGEETLWYKYAEENIEYDSLGRDLSSELIQTGDNDAIVYKSTLTYTYADDSDSNYTVEQRESWPTDPDAEDKYSATKYERIYGNPISDAVYYKDAENTDWSLSYKHLYYYPKGTVANETIKADTPAIKAYAANGTLFINLNGTAPVQVYSVNGTCHYNATASGNITIANLPAGIYIVKAGDETMKISVR